MQVDELTWTELRDAIKAAQADRKQPIDLLMRSADTFRTLQIDYHDGLRYPQLQRIEHAPDRLSEMDDAPICDWCTTSSAEAGARQRGRYPPARR